MPIFDDYDDFHDDETPVSQELWDQLKKQRYETKKKSRQRDAMYEVGEVPPLTPEMLEKRKHYETDYVDMHQHLFPRSTGIKPFGPVQIESIRRTYHTLTHGGRSVIAEPRGFGKTSRTANNALMAVLQGKVKYALILASSVTKATEILESIKTELVDNQELAKLYPAVCACFEHLGESSAKAKRQTYKGELTYLGYSVDRIRMPQIPGEPCAGSVIQVRPKDNVRGLFTKVRYGENAGTVLRPDFVFMDDIQTDEEAGSATSVSKIVQTIKKSVLFAGTHSKRLSAVMCCTPIEPGDVSAHFILNELSWDCVLSKMVPKMPDNLDMWLTDYATILMDFDRNQTGSRTKAQLRAKTFVEENYDALHQGAEVAWDWAYGWNEEPQTEISALQHAMNFLIEEGQDAFESECQCNVLPSDESQTDVLTNIDTIVNKLHNHKRFHCPVETKYVTTHIDINKRILSYVTVGSSDVFRPMVLDYGTWPEQHGAMWKKESPAIPLHKAYPNIPEHNNQIYQGLKDLLAHLKDTTYYREDGLEMFNNLITVDMGYEIDEVQRAVRDSEARQVTCCYRGTGIRAKDKPFMDRHYGSDCTKHFHCATVPTTDRVLTALYADVNFFKVLVHRGFNTRDGMPGSISMFNVDRTGEHLLFAKHIMAETPTEDFFEKENRRVTVWSHPRGDNEWFDNLVGCCANLFKLGVEMRAKRAKAGTFSMKDYIDAQKDSNK